LLRFENLEPSYGLS